MVDRSTLPIRHHRVNMLAALLSVFVLCFDAIATYGQKNAESVSAIQQQNPSFLVRIDTDRNSRDYREGDSFSLNVAAEIDSYLYVIYQQADGRSYQVFPNAAQPNNRLRARQVVKIPEDDDLFRWRIAPPFGTETVKVIATEKPLKGLSDPKLRSKRFNLLSDPIIKGIGLELGEDLSEHESTSGLGLNVDVDVTRLTAVAHETNPQTSEACLRFFL